MSALFDVPTLSWKCQWYSN